MVATKFAVFVEKFLALAIRPQFSLQKDTRNTELNLQ